MLGHSGAHGDGAASLQQHGARSPSGGAYIGQSPVATTSTEPSDHGTVERVSSAGLRWSVHGEHELGMHRGNGDYGDGTMGPPLC